MDNQTVRSKCKEIINRIADSLSDLQRSDNGEERDIEDDNERDTELGKLSEDDETDWVMDKNSKQYGISCNGFSKHRSTLTNWCNWAWGTRPTRYMRSIWTMWKPNCWFRQLINCKQTMIQTHLHWPFVSWWRPLIASSENHKWCRSLLDYVVFIRG